MRGSAEPKAVILVDTNIIVALLLGHPLNASAADVFRIDPDWHMPDWWQIEFANVLRNYHRSGQLEADDAIVVLGKSQTLFPPRNTHSVDLGNTLRIACGENITAYDARFIALARSFSMKLVSEDARLRSACPADTLSLAEALSSMSP